MVAPTTNTTTTNVLTTSSNNDRLGTNSDDDSRYISIKSDRHDGDLYVRTSWTDASIALSQLDKVKSNSITKNKKTYRVIKSITFYNMRSTTRRLSLL